MTPVWLFDFIEKGSLESFFSTYHNALLQSDHQLDPARWFYVTEAKDPAMSVQMVDDASKRLLVDTNIDGVPTEKLIPAWNNRRNKFLNIVFVGDVEDVATQKYFLGSLKCLQEKRGQISAANVRFYALLWRPDSACVEPGLSAAGMSFVRELEQVMKNNENNRFHKVLFFESSIMPAEKQKALSSMSIAALHIATHADLGDNDELIRAHNNTMYNAGAAGVFYEKLVQKEQETFFLSNILLDSLTHGSDERFVSPKQATEYLDSQSVFFEMFTPEMIASELKADCASVPSDKAAYSVESEVSPFSLKLKAVWKKYYNDYLVNLKANLINKAKKALMEFAYNYKETLYAAQNRFVNKIKDDIEAKVFEIFRAPENFEAVSIPQAMEILEKLRLRIAEKANDPSISGISSFIFPKYLEGAREQVEAEIRNNDPNEVIAILESKLKRHPVFLLSMFVRSVVLGALLCYAGITFVFGDMSEGAIWGIGTLLFLIPLVISAWSFREYMVRINSLKDQYAACVLVQYKRQLDDELRRCVSRTYADIDKFCEWLKVHKLEFLQRNMSVVSPPEFSFTPSSRFQPLVKCMPYGASNVGRLLVPAMKVDVDTQSDLSGSFGKYPILDNPPVSKVLVRGDGYSFDEIIQDRIRNLQRDLMRQMLKSTAKASGNVELNVNFESIRSPRTKLLLLDVSGSMSDSDMLELKEAVDKLSRTAAIKWIAFNDHVVACGDTPEEFGKIQSDGGTNYIPAILKAKEITDSEVVDQVILISDGQPFESVEEILTEAYKLGQPLHTVSIGSAGASVMKQISDMTSGEQIVVNNLKELSADVESKFNVIFTLGLTGEYTFAELMRKVYIPGCAEALHAFASRQMSTGVTTIGDLICDCANPMGMAEWENVASPSCTHSNAVAPRKSETKTYVQMVCEAKEKDAVADKFSDRFTNVVLDEQKDTPEILVSVLSLRPLTEVTDIMWANYKK